MTETKIKRCEWCGTDPLYVEYHDEEWGRPSHDDTHLFEMLCLEGQQAGLSWITVLKKRARYREQFSGFEIDRVAVMRPASIDSRMTDAGLIRHRGKLEAIVSNARAAKRIIARNGSLSEYLWRFTDPSGKGQPVVNGFTTLKQIPTKTAQAEAMSKALKKKGFRFVGPTTCYAFMQACGLVDDHLESCFVRGG
ncbi:MAG: DNA-3-methyladenine glycosylase I [Phycisphaerales bacterium]|jgi:DNA-3-methyladenine glycosylase I